MEPIEIGVTACQLCRVAVERCAVAGEQVEVVRHREAFAYFVPVFSVKRVVEPCLIARRDASVLGDVGKSVFDLQIDFTARNFFFFRYKFILTSFYASEVDVSGTAVVDINAAMPAWSPALSPL